MEDLSRLRRNYARVLRRFNEREISRSIALEDLEDLEFEARRIVDGIRDTTSAYHWDANELKYAIKKARVDLGERKAVKISGKGTYAEESGGVINEGLTATIKTIDDEGTLVNEIEFIDAELQTSRLSEILSGLDKPTFFSGKFAKKQEYTESYGVIEAGKRDREELEAKIEEVKKRNAMEETKLLAMKDAAGEFGEDLDFWNDDEDEFFGEEIVLVEASGLSITLDDVYQMTGTKRREKEEELKEKGKKKKKVFKFTDNMEKDMRNMRISNPNKTAMGILMALCGVKRKYKKGAFAEKLSLIANMINDENFLSFKNKDKDKQRVIFIPSGGGKSTLAEMYPEVFVDIDSLPNEREREILDALLAHEYASKYKQFDIVNKMWNIVVNNHRLTFKDKILLMHHEAQGNQVLQLDGISVFTEFGTKELTEINKEAIREMKFPIFKVKTSDLLLFAFWHFRRDYYNIMFKK